VPGHLGNREAIRRLVDGVGTVFHLAGVVRAVNSEDFDSVNRGGTARLVSALRDVAPDARLVFVSSLAAVGPSAVPIGVSPDAKPHPISDYGRSKLAAEKEVGGVTGANWWSIVRPPAVYGPRDSDVFQFFRMARTGLMLLPVGERWITVAHVADVVRGTLAAVVGEPGRTYHLGEPKPLRMEDLLRQLARVGRVKARILKVPSVVVRAAGIGGSVLWRFGLRRVAMTPDKAREILSRHWTSQTRDSLKELGIGEWTAFADGVGETWDWYRQQKWLS
jgi:nucleoside-diphosphate-sugar epimerase